MSPLASVRSVRRVGFSTLAVALVTSVLAVPLGAVPAGATPSTSIYGSPSGSDTTGTTGCTTTTDRCSLQGALDAAAAVSSGTVTIYLEAAGTSTTYQGEFNTLYSFDDPGLDVTVQPDPSFGAGAVSVFDARFVPGSSILTLSGSGSVTLDDVEMDNADSRTSGGAIRITSDLTLNVNGATFDHDQTIANSNGGAIGIDNGATAQLNVNDATFVDNWAIGVGGAIGGFQNDGVTTVTNSTFSGNHGDYGGAIGEGAYGAGSLVVADSTFEGNSAMWGGAIDNADIAGASNAFVQESTFLDNVASATGGEIANGLNSGTGSLVLIRSSVDDGTGATAAIAAGGGTTSVAGSIVAGAATALCVGDVVDAGFNLEADASASCGFSSSSDAPAGSDPGFAALADNGGPTLTESVAGTSPAAAAIPSTPETDVSIGASNYVVCANPDTDQTGVAQAVSGGCAMGALDATHLVAQATPRVLAPAGDAPANQSVALSAWGATGPSHYVFTSSTPGCAVHGSTLSFAGTTVPLTCEVSVVNAASGAYLDSPRSSDQAFTFVAAAPASPLTVTSTQGVFATPLALATSGGSSGGAFTFSVVDGSASGCAISASAPFVLTSATAGTCVVQASQTAAGEYQATTSAPSAVELVATTPSAPSIRLFSRGRGLVYIAVTVPRLGGAPQIALQYSLNGGRFRAAIRHGRGLIEITGLRATMRITVRVRVFTVAGASAASPPLRFLAR